MKRLICLLLLCAFLLSGCSLVFDTELHKEIKEIIEEADIELVTEYYFYLYEVNAEYADGSTTREEYTYDHNAPVRENIPKSCEYYENDVLIGTETFTHDGYGNLVQATPDWEGGQVRRFMLGYDEDGTLLSRTLYLDDVCQYGEAYVYDAEGRITELTTYHGAEADGVLTEHLVSRTVTEYNENGRRSRITHYNDKNAVMFYEICEFDEQKYKETVFRYNAGGILLGYVRNGLDINYNIVEEKIYDASDTLLSTTYFRFITGSYTYNANAPTDP